MLNFMRLELECHQLVMTSFRSAELYCSAQPPAGTSELLGRFNDAHHVDLDHNIDAGLDTRKYILNTNYNMAYLRSFTRSALRSSGFRTRHVVPSSRRYASFYNSDIAGLTDDQAEVRSCF